MSYQVLARKWRPQRFQDVVGQEHITTTLQNAIRKNRVGHAYLFVGPRGIGKTTSARIFAKALNCSHPQAEQNNRYEPCCECETCREIAAGNCLDVIEIDGASHNKVENVRDLRETVQYAPTHGRKYKIYIIDEVHMLTTAAWNALLKTLEEPPPHVKFLFATTEAHKVLPTITSRCQRFDLKRIGVRQIVAKLKQIAGDEGIFIDDRALTAVARAADGGMRDAQSILDQMTAFCGGTGEDAKITDADVMEVFGLTSSADIRAVVDALISDQATELIADIHRLADGGRNLERFYADLLLYLRDLLIVQLVPDPAPMIELDESGLADLQAQTGKCAAAVTQRLLENLMAQETTLRYALNKLICLEVTLLRAMKEAHAATVDEVIGQLQRLKTSAAIPASAVSHAPPLGSERSSAIDQTQQDNVDQKPAPSATDPRRRVQSDTNRVQDTHAPAPSPAPPTTTTYSTHPDPAANSISVQESSNPEDTMARAVQLWHLLIKEVGNVGGKATLPLHMKEAKPLSFQNGVLKVGFSDDFPEEDLRDLLHHNTQKLLTKILSHAATLPDATIQIERTSETFAKTGKRDRRTELTSSPEVWEALKGNEFVRTVCTVFNGQIMDVRG